MGFAIIPIVAGLVLIGILFVVALLIVRRGNRCRTQASATPVRMSPDGRYWWDGQSWRDAEQMAPPNAMRSADGYYWWDGTSWRRVPAPAPAPVPVATLSPN